MNVNNKKVVLVTGASSGMGKDSSLRLIREGCIVYGAARRLPQMADITAAGGHVLAVDVTDDASMVMLFLRAVLSDRMFERIYSAILR